MENTILETKEQVIKCLSSLATDRNNVYRGYSYLNQLNPGLMRKGLVAKECELLSEFERYANLYYKATNVVDFLACAQHYGLPTRLLDFSYNPFIALYFSLYNEKDETRCVYPEEKDYYFVRYCNTNDNILIKNIPIFNKGYFYEIDSLAQEYKYLLDTINKIFDEDYPFDQEQSFIKDNYSAARAFFKSLAVRMNEGDVDSYFEKEFKKVHNRKLLLIDTNKSNQRLLLQQGLFMFSYDLDNNNHINILSNNTGIIKIPSKLRTDLLEFLDTIGINTFKLMPELTSVCHEIERQVKKNKE